MYIEQAQLWTTDKKVVLFTQRYPLRSLSSLTWRWPGVQEPGNKVGSQNQANSSSRIWYLQFLLSSSVNPFLLSWHYNDDKAYDLTHPKKTLLGLTQKKSKSNLIKQKKILFLRPCLFLIDVYERGIVHKGIACQLRIGRFPVRNKLIYLARLWDPRSLWTSSRIRCVESNIR